MVQITFTRNGIYFNKHCCTQQIVLLCLLWYYSNCFFAKVSREDCWGHLNLYRNSAKSGGHRCYGHADKKCFICHIIAKSKCQMTWWKGSPNPNPSSHKMFFYNKALYKFRFDFFDATWPRGLKVKYLVCWGFHHL